MVYNNPAQPATPSGKAQVAHEAMGGEGKPPKNLSKGHKIGGKLHGIDIEAASNGFQLTHRVKKFKKNNDEAGASDHPTFEDMVSTKHVIGDNHPMAAHINAIHDYCTDCNED